MVMEPSGLTSDVMLGVDISVEVLGNKLSVAVCKAELSTAVFGTVPSVAVLAAELFIVVEFGAELPVHVTVVTAGSVTMLISGTVFSPELTAT